VVWRSTARSSVLRWEQQLPFGAPARLAPRLHCHWRRDTLCVYVITIGTVRTRSAPR
jgi:hypothetical protein